VQHRVRIAGNPTVFTKLGSGPSQTQKKAGDFAPASFRFRSQPNGLESESHACDSLAQTAHLPGNGVLVQHAAGDAAGELGLSFPQRLSRDLLVAAGDRLFDLLDEAADAADPGTVDFRANGVAALTMTGNVWISPTEGLRSIPATSRTSASPVISESASSTIMSS